MQTIQINFAGNLTADPEIRYMPNGKAVVTLRIAASDRKFDRQSGRYIDHPSTTFFTGEVFGDLAENVQETLRKGLRVIVFGQLHTDTFTDRNGEQRVVQKVTIDEVGPSLQYATCDIHKAGRSVPPPAEDLVVSQLGGKVLQVVPEPEPAF